MAKCISFGLTPGHHSVFGIDYANIAKQFTRLNWDSKAIVRDGHYICISIGEYDDEKKNRIKRYFITGCPEKKGFKKEYKYLKDAMKAANNYSKKEGEWPKESTPGWTIFTKNNGYMRKIGEFKLFENEK